MSVEEKALEKLKPFKVTTADVKSGAAKFKVDVPHDKWAEINSFIKQNKIQSSPPEFGEDAVRIYFTAQHAKCRVADFLKTVK